jgi:hypothetical protein
MLKQATRWQLIARNPASDLQLPTVAKSEMVTLTREQAGGLRMAAEQRPLMRYLVLLGIATGARLGELLALTWSDVDLEQGAMRIGRSRRIVGGQMQVKGPKTEASYRTVALGPIVIAALRRLRAEQAERRLALGVDYHDEDLVICKPDGRPYRPDSTSTQFRKFVDSIGLPRTVHVHTLRHSAASLPGCRWRTRLLHCRSTRPQGRRRACPQGLRSSAGRGARPCWRTPGSGRWGRTMSQRGRNPVEVGRLPTAVACLGLGVFAGRWRQGWDSNPWTPCDVNGFRDRPIRPLWHLAVAEYSGGR